MRKNRLSEIDLREARWKRMEVLNLGENFIADIRGIELLDNLNALNLGASLLSHVSQQSLSFLLSELDFTR